MQDSLEIKYERDPGMVFRDIAGEAVLVPIVSKTANLDSIYTLNRTAVAVWNRLDGRNTVREIALELASEYDIPIKEAERDMIELLQQLESISAVTKAG